MRCSGNAASACLWKTNGRATACNSQFYLFPVFRRCPAGDFLKLGNEMVYAVIPGFIGNMGNIHIRINKQPACVLNPYFGQATENALVRTLPEVSAQRRRVLVDKLRYFPKVTFSLKWL